MVMVPVAGEGDWQEFFICDFLFPVFVCGIEYKLADSSQHVSVSCNTYIIERVIFFFFLESLWD